MINTRNENEMMTADNRGAETLRTCLGPTVVDGLEKLLLLEGLPIVLVPSDVYCLLLDSDCVRDRVTPAFVRDHFSVINGAVVRHPSVNYDYNENKNENDKADGRVEGKAEGSVGKMSKEDCLSNALFLLQYACSDLSGDASQLRIEGRQHTDIEGLRDRNKPTFSSLHGLSVLPLDDGSLGVIEDPTGLPLYLCNEAERRILSRAGKRIVVADSLLGNTVSSVLRHPEFPFHCNIHPLSPLDMLKVLRTFLPVDWFSGSVSTITNRGTEVTDEWLSWLWAYIIQEKAVGTFEGAFPLLPVLSPASMPSGSYLVKISFDVPVLHMSFKDLPPDAADALSRLGVYVLNSSVLGGSAYSQDICRLISAASPKGLLQAICVVAKKESFTRTISSWSKELKRTFKNLILDHVISKMENEPINDVEKDILLSIPVWEKHNYGKHDEYDVFSALNTPYTTSNDPSSSSSSSTTYLMHQIPPKDINSVFLGSQFLVLRSSLDRSLYGRLGIEEPSKG